MVIAEQRGPVHGAPGEIVLSLEVREGQVRLRVSDNGSGSGSDNRSGSGSGSGSGIVPSVLPHVYELFTQAERTSDRVQGWLGLDWPWSSTSWLCTAAMSKRKVKG